MQGPPDVVARRWTRKQIASVKPEIEAAQSEVYELEVSHTSVDCSAGQDELEKESECEIFLPRRKEHRRWRRENDTMQRYDSHRSLACNVMDDEDNTVVNVIKGLCPKSKLSLTSSAQLLLNPSIAHDFASVLQGGAHHLKNIFASSSDMDLFSKLKAEIEDSGLWRQRCKDKYERTIAPEGGQRTTGRITGEDALTLARLPAHRYVLEHLATLFNSKPLSWWINLYPNGSDSKNFHKDNFGQNITIGASFGATRNLTFRHGQTRDEFHFPQENGDVFAFRENVNNVFLHGMYQLKQIAVDPGPRISVIMMGRSLA